MAHNRRLFGIMICFGIAAAGTIAFTLKAQQPATPKAQSASPPANLPEVWTSQATKHDFRVKVEKDLFTAEWINLPPEAARQGAFIRTECRRSEKNWIGTSRVVLPCAAPGDAKGKATKACPMTLRFELSSISKDRIVGRSESLRNFDCEKCQVRETGWGDFVWVPKK